MNFSILRLANVPPITRGTILVSFLLSMLYAAFRYRAYVAQTETATGSIIEQSSLVPILTVVPGISYLFPWTFVTATYVQQNILTVQLLNEYLLMIVCFSNTRTIVCWTIP
jgi:hypothetical protein